MISNMEVSGVQSAQAAVQTATATNDRRADLQLALLKKILDAQKNEAAMMQNMMDGKGQILDIRV